MADLINIEDISQARLSRLIQNLEVEIDGPHLKIHYVNEGVSGDLYTIPLGELVARFVDHKRQVLDKNQADARCHTEAALGELFELAGLFRFFADQCEFVGKDLAKKRWRGNGRIEPADW